MGETSAAAVLVVAVFVLGLLLTLILRWLMGFGWMR